jgi:lipopolysaccharide export system protein LptA
MGALRATVLAMTVALTTAALSGAAAQQPKQERKVIASGGVAEIDQAHNTVLLTDGAKLTTAEGTITSREMEVRFGKANAVETAEARREVKLDYRYTTKDGVERVVTATADKAIYDSAARTVQLFGSVTGELREPAQQRVLNLTAEEVTLWIDESRLRLRPAQLVFTEVVEKPQAQPAPKP